MERYPRKPEDEQGSRPGIPENPVDPARRSPLRPNMLCLNADVTSSTFSALRSGHSLIAGSSYFNSAFHRTNFENTAFHACDFDGAVVENCSLRGVELRNCDIEGLVVDGIRVGALLKAILLRQA